MTFRETKGRLREALREKLRRGEISERRLARDSGYTQPHIHNVLKGVRGLNADLADAILGHLGMSVEELIDVPGSGGVPAAVPVGRGSIGPREAFPDGTLELVRCGVPTSLQGLFDPVMWRVADDEDEMVPLVKPGDWVLVDRAESDRRLPVFERIYALSLAGHGAICRCQRVGSALALVADNARSLIKLPDRISLGSHEIVEVVRGRVVWVCRKL